MATTTQEVDVSTPSDLYNAMKENWDLTGALLGGTKAMREAADAYLPREEGESTEGYNARLARSFLFPAFQRTIAALVGKVFAEEVSLNDGAPADLAAGREAIHLGHHDIQQHQVRRLGPHLLKGLLPVAGADGLVVQVIQLLFQVVHVVGFIVHDQDFRLLLQDPASVHVLATPGPF